MNPLILILIMAVAAMFGAAGQIMLKKGAESLTLTSIAANWPLAAFAALYGAAVLLNILAYRLGGRVSILYPVISLSYAFAAFLSWKFLGEHISIWTIIGTATIIIGVSIIGYGATRPI